MLSAFAGIRPLVRSGDSRITAALSRDHTIHVDPSGLLTITGGKWTTYRHMAEDTVDQAALLAHLPKKLCVTRTLRVHGCDRTTAAASGPLAVYGTDAAQIAAIMRAEPELAAPLHPDLPCDRRGSRVGGARTRWRGRSRTCWPAASARCCSTPRAAVQMAPAVATLMARELGWDAARIEQETADVLAVARGYQIESAVVR